MKFAVIGYGSFGSNVAKTLFEKGHEVLVIDRTGSTSPRPRISRRTPW